MWPDSKGKGGKEGSPKSKDGGGEATKPNAGASGSSSGAKSGGKGRNTKTKMKAIAAQGGPPQDVAEASAKLEQDIINAAHNLSQGEAKAEETKTLIEINRVPESSVSAGPPEAASAANLIRLSESSNENIDDKISSLWKSKVLGAYRANPKSSQHILPAMPNNKGALEISDKARGDAQQAAMISLVDKMFDRFQNLAFEFNNVAQGSELELTWIRPTISRENISSWHQAAQVVSVFTGRISTRRWTMVVRGTLDSVLAYAIPADKLLTFSNQPANFQPVIELIPFADGLTVRWSAFGCEVSQEELHNIHRALLDNMIRIAQDDAPCDCFIDLAAYGVVLGGGVAQGTQANQAQGQVVGQDIDYGAKYQQEFYHEDSGPAFLGQGGPSAGSPSNATSPSAGLPVAGGRSAPGSIPAAQAEVSVHAGGSADWKPMESSGRSGGPAASITSMGGQQNQGQDQWREAPAQSVPPAAAGFNQDEPWKYASSSGSPGAANPSINSFVSRTGPPRPQQGFVSGAGAGRPGQFPGDQHDEPPLPSLPAHLFEGLPARPQNSASAPAPSSPSASFGSRSSGFGEQAPAPSASQSFQNGQPQPWSGQASGAFNSGVSSTSQASSSSSSDGWKSTGIPVTKAMQNLPPVPVPGYQSSAGSPFSSEPAAMGNSLLSPESFTSGSIRLDAIAREIAHSPVHLPPAIPGFEPYTVDEPKPEPPRPIVEAPPQPILYSPEPAQGDQQMDTWPETSTEDPTKPWPKPRARTVEEDDPPVEPAEVAPEQAKFEPVAKMDQFARKEREERTAPDLEENAFINFDSEPEPEVQSAYNAEEDDAEIAALFEGEPVNSGDNQESVKASAPSSSAPAYMAWLEPEPGREEDDRFEHPVGHVKLQSEAQDFALSSSRVEQDLSVGQDEEGLSAPSEMPIDHLVPEEQEPSPQNSDQVFSHLVPDQFSEDGGVVARAPQREEEGETQKPSQLSRAAIEEGFRQAQAAAAASHFDAIAAENSTDIEPASPVVATAGQSVSSAAHASVLIAPGASGDLVMAARSLNADIDRLLSNLDGELELISGRGSEAFARRDLKGAERMIKLAETLGEFKDWLTKLKEEHGSDLS